MKVHQEICRIGIGGFFQALFSQIALDGGLYFGAQDITIGIGLTGHGFTAPQVVP
jgi:hypothetical protein